MPNPDTFTLYWSSLDMYEKCPQSFLWNKGWGVIDVGGGPGQKKPKPYKKSEHHAVMGTVIQAVVERFYNDELWNVLQPMMLRDRLLELADEYLRLELAKRFVDWRLAGMTREEMAKTVRDGILGYMRTMKAHRLLGPYAKAELDMVAYVNKWTPIGGRADLVVRRDDTGTTIVDGKNGRRYKDGKIQVDPDQLRWYALCFWLSYHQMPDRLGFVYYRYPSGDPILDADGKDTGAKEPGVEWIPYTRDDLKGLAQRAVDARKAMNKERFQATPDWRACRYCDYESVCPERQSQKANNRRSPKSVEGLLDGIGGADGGIVEFTMGSEKP